MLGELSLVVALAAQVASAEPQMAPVVEGALSTAASPLGGSPLPAAPVTSAEAAAKNQPSVPQAPRAGRVLSLHEAEQTALVNQPAIRQAKAQTDASFARADETEAPFFPQVSGSANYSRATGNFVRRAGSLPSNLGGGSTSSNTSFKTYDQFNFGVNANQLVYDFGQTSSNHRAAQANAEAEQASMETTRQGVLFSVRSAYLQAWADRALLDVAKDNLSNQDKHLEQVTALVKAGSRPEIDLAQVRADRANAELLTIQTENNYETAKAQLNQAMGVERSTDFDVADDHLGEVSGEGLDDDRLTNSAQQSRPELRVVGKQLEADERSLSAVKGQYGPTLGVSAGVTEGGPELNEMAWNFNVGANLAWPIFQGGVTNARVREAEANRASTESQVSLVRQQIRFEVTQARLAVRAGKASLDTAKVVEANARERLRLAEARYRAGAGSIIELQDAQVAATTASGQVVQANFALSLARAQILKALGRP